MPALSYKSNFVDYVAAGLLYIAYVKENGCCPWCKQVITNAESVCKNPNCDPWQRVKRQTIRNFRVYPVKPGDKLYHYYAQRTKHSRKLGESICKSAERIEIRDNMILIGGAINPGIPDLKDQASLDAFAYADGFANWREMKLWWKLTHGQNCFPFVGQLIQW